MNGTVIFLASNRKGDELFAELSRRFSSSYYVRTDYTSLPLPYRLSIRVLDRAGIRLKDRPDFDYRLRLSIGERARTQVGSIVKETKGPVCVFFWQCLFPITRDWQDFGRLSFISDVPMTEAYFDNFRIRTPKARALRERIRATTVENCENLFTHSDWAAEENRRLYPNHADKISRMGWGPDLPRISREEALSERTEKRILCVGHDYLRKGVDFYDQVAGRLKERIPGLECLVAGLPGRKFSVRTLCHLKVLGPLPRPQLAEQLKAASLFALFSRFEPAGHVTVEAMSYGVPVLCSNKGGIAEPVVDGVTGYVCPSFLVDLAVERACSILNDPDRLAHFRERAFDHAHNCWLWSHAADRIIRRLACEQDEVLTR